MCGPLTCGPFTQVDSQIQEIQDRRAENLAILDERYENAYIHGDQEEMWAIEAQMDWWTNVLLLKLLVISTLQCIDAWICVAQSYALYFYLQLCIY